MKTYKHTKKTGSSWHKFSHKLAGPTLAACVASSLSLHAQGNSTNSVDPELVNKLLQRVDELEKKSKQVDALESQLTALQIKTGELATPVKPVERFPKITFHMLGDVDFVADNLNGGHNQFEVGDIDLVTTAQLNDKASVLSDFVVASNHGGFAFEIERLIASYRFNEYFNLDAGRFHTAMGWYNNFYHNGTYFQTTVNRPWMYEFEDNSGLLPVHSTGLSLNGEIPSGKWGLSYSLEVANGRTYTANEDEALTIEDDNSSKSLNFQLRAKPEWAPNWQFSAGAYHDSPTPELDPVGDPGVKTHMDQLIFSGSAIYKTPVWEWFTEAALVGNEPAGGQRYWTTAAYSQVSHKFGKLRPYLRVQYQNVNEGDLLFGLIGQSGWAVGEQLGVRYDFTSMMALKFQYDHATTKNDPALNQFTAQWTFCY